MAYLLPEKMLEPIVEYCFEKSSQSCSVLYSSFWKTRMIDYTPDGYFFRLSIFSSSDLLLNYCLT